MVTLGRYGTQSWTVYRTYHTDSQTPHVVQGMMLRPAQKIRQYLYLPVVYVHKFLSGRPEQRATGWKRVYKYRKFDFIPMWFTCSPYFSYC